MPQLKVNLITSRSGNNSPELLQGAIIPSGKTISNSGGMVVDGTLTGAFSGDGSGISNIVDVSRTYAIKLIVDSGNQVPYRS